VNCPKPVNVPDGDSIIIRMTVSGRRSRSVVAVFATLACPAARIAGTENTNGDHKAQTAMENVLQLVPDVNAAYTITEPAADGVTPRCRQPARLTT